MSLKSRRFCGQHGVVRWLNSGASWIRVAILALSVTPALCDVGGNCSFQQASHCNNEGAACTIDGKAGKCTTQHTQVADWCFCAVNGKQLDETKSTGTSSGQAIPLAPATVIFSLSPSATGIASLPKELGGGAIEYSSYAGSVTMKSQPTGNSSVDDIYIQSGTIVQSSLTIPPGIPTGPNTFTFVPQSVPSGTLNRTTGAFSFTANGTIKNNLMPSDGSAILTEGRYFGTLNMATGVATIDTITFDTYQSLSIPTISWWGQVGLIVAVIIATSVGLHLRYRRRTRSQAASVG
jgi:hypothetical protein